ncbi:hypothetical protein FRB94_013690 [Tulasnella sp. JGI-2019a]|nr:hypothetical protein FRB93_011963 [Tulasnella sp. JGI-2019a]KAG9008133.1 hypothetical protein FRB94_013690 [Tulasnella sp. JGI-2019a]KAG9033516.1 hypothetical protein FRB95_014695 [Tulasnella sp. JGI-2019a]
MEHHHQASRRSQLSSHNQHYINVIEALIAPTQIEDTTPYDAQEIAGHQSMSSNIHITPSDAPSTIRQPFQDIAGYAARAFLPPLPPQISKALEEHQTRLLTKDINWGIVTTIKKVRSVPSRDMEGLLACGPMGGKRSLAEIEQIDGEWLAKAAFRWNDRRVPRCLDVFKLIKFRPDLFVTFNNGSFNVPVFKTSAVCFTIPAFGFSTEEIPSAFGRADGGMAVDGEDDGYDTEPEDDGATRHSASARPSSTGLRPHPSAFDSMADLNQSLSVVSRSISGRYVVNAGATPWPSVHPANIADDNDDDTASIASSPSTISINPATTRLLSRLPEFFRSTMLATAASLVHTSEPDKTLGWEWSSLQDSRKLVQQHRTIYSNKPKAATPLPTGWSAWIWGRKPLQPCRKEQGDRRFLEDEDTLWRSADQAGSQTPLPRGYWMRGPGSKNEDYPIESRENKYSFSELAMVCFLVSPTLGLTEQDLVDLCQSQEFSDGARGEGAFTPAETAWAAIYDVCKELDIKFFAISTYSSIAFGAFSTSFESAFISPPMSTLAPTSFNPNRGPLMPDFEPSFGAQDGTQRRAHRRPNAVQTLAYWMRSGMGNCTEGWVIPNSVDGTSGWSGSMVLNESFTEPTAHYFTKEWVWPFLKSEAASEKALEDAREFVTQVLAEDKLSNHASSSTSGLSRTYTQVQVAEMFGVQSSFVGRSDSTGGPLFVGGAEYNSAMLEARHAQVAQRLDVEAMHGGDGAEDVPLIAPTNAQGAPLARAWEELDRERAGPTRVLGTGIAVLDWLRPTEEPEVNAPQIRQVTQLPTPNDSAVDDARSNVGVVDLEHPAEDNDMAVEPTDPHAVLASVHLQIPNAVFFPSNTPGELPLIQNSATKELYRIFGTTVVKVGDPNIMIDRNVVDELARTEEDDMVEESEVADLIKEPTASRPPSSFSDLSSLTSLSDVGEPMTPLTAQMSENIGSSAVKGKGRAIERPIRDGDAPKWLAPRPVEPKTPGKRQRSTNNNEFAEPEPRVKKAKMSRRASAAVDDGDEDDEDDGMFGNLGQSSSSVKPAPRRISARLSGSSDRPIKSLRSRKGMY